jgi:LacI family transcriptional regulator
MPSTIKDIAELTGLGIATISKYINGGTVLAKNKEKIDAAIEQLDFHVNSFARGLKTSKSKTIGVVIPELSNIFSSGIITIIEDILRRAGYGILVCDCRTDEKLEREAVGFLLNKMVDGIINMPVSSSGEHLLAAIERHIPVVLIDRKVELPLDAVLIENENASRQAIECFISNGHTRIGIICGEKSIYTTEERLLGYENALNAAGLKYDDGLVAYGNYTVQGGYEGMKRLLEREISAVFVTNYEMTLGAIIAINELGIHIPDEISFIGFDNLQLSQVVKPRLSIIYQPTEKIAEDAAMLLINSIKQGEQHEPCVIKHETALLRGNSIKNIKHLTMSSPRL